MLILFIISVFFIWAFILNKIAHFLVNSKKPYALFPYFEIAMTILFTALWHTTFNLIPYFILFSALGVTIQTDISHMLISRFVSLYLVPTGIILSFFDYLPIHWLESIIASIAGYTFFYLINTIFYTIKQQDGLGQGDLDLIALIGSYTGILGIWFSILFGSLIGLVSAASLMIYNKKRLSYIPFGPSLAIATMLFIIFQTSIRNFVL